MKKFKVNNALRKVRRAPEFDGLCEFLTGATIDAAKKLGCKTNGISSYVEINDSDKIFYILFITYRGKVVIKIKSDLKIENHHGNRIPTELLRSDPDQIVDVICDRIEVIEAAHVKAFDGSANPLVVIAIVVGIIAVIIFSVHGLIRLTAKPDPTIKTIKSVQHIQSNTGETVIFYSDDGHSIKYSNVPQSDRVLDLKAGDKFDSIWYKLEN